jgi:hypothetical protein
MTAIQHIVAYLLTRPNWKPDRFERTGPNFHADVPREKRRPAKSKAPEELRARVLAALRHGESTGSQITARIGYRLSLVNAMLTKLWKEGVLARSRKALSPVTRRPVYVYGLKQP